MSALSWSEGARGLMPFFFSRLRYSRFFCLKLAQLRVSASAPALSSAVWLGLSSASNAALLTSAEFFGSQAWLFKMNLRCSKVLVS